MRSGTWPVGHRSGRDGQPTTNSAVTFRERVRARAVSLGLQTELFWEATGTDTPVKVQQLNVVTLHRGSAVLVDANAGAAAAFLNFGNPVAANPFFVVNANSTPWLFVARVNTALGVATTDIRLGVFSNGGVSNFGMGVQIGNANAIKICDNTGGVGSQIGTLSANTWHDVRIEYPGAGNVSVYLDGMFLGSAANVGANTLGIPGVLTAKTASNDNIAVDKIACWCTDLRAGSL